MDKNHFKRNIDAPPYVHEDQAAQCRISGLSFRRSRVRSQGDRLDLKLGPSVDLFAPLQSVFANMFFLAYDVGHSRTGRRLAT